MQITFLGTGDAFGSGGRFNTCFHVAPEDGTPAFLIDCGASSMIAIRKFAVDPNGIATVFLSHLHGDHFCGLPFFLLDAQLYAKRTEPLTIVGPPGTQARLITAMEVMFPGSAGTKRKFEISFVEIAPDRPAAVNGVAVVPFEARHDAGAPAYALRLGVEDKVIAYSGDGEWTDDLGQAAAGADLFIAEALFRNKKIPGHLDLESLEQGLGTAPPKRLILTHFGPDMLRQLDDIEAEKAEDGMIIMV